MNAELNRRSFLSSAAILAAGCTLDDAAGRAAALALEHGWSASDAPLGAAVALR